MHLYLRILSYNKQIKTFLLLSVASLVCFTARVSAQDDYNARAKKYIETYSQLAITEQRTSGIPACVTLGQGILETEAGNSELMTMANNHFGIKCKNGWEGETFLHTDDAENECFKKYKCAEDSYRDHSQHLKINPRYSSLFTLPMTDYAAWARGLKRCGYATDPQYAHRLIKIIEDFDLQQYTYAALDSSKNRNAALVAKQQTPTTPNPKLVDVIEDTTKFVIDRKKEVEEQPLSAAPVTDTGKKQVVTQDTLIAKTTDTVKNTADTTHNLAVQTETVVPTPVIPTPIDTTGIVKVNGLKAFYAHKGDMLLQYAMTYNVRYSKLLEINDLADGPLPADAYIYLEKKLSSGTHETHIVEYGETMWVIAQKEGMQLKKLTSMNLLSADELPVTGAVLQLQFPSAKKPAVVLVPTTAHTSNSIIIVTPEDKAAAMHDSDYIALKKPATTAPDAEFMRSTDSTAQTDSKTQKKPIPPAKPAPTFPKPTPTTPVVQAPPPVVVVTTKAPADKNAPLHWASADTVAPVKKETPTEDETDAKHEEFARLKAELDRVVYADDSKLVAKIQSEQPPVQKKVEEQPQAAAKSTKYYTVKKGDTAFSIAKRNKITVNQLLKWNDIDADEIKIGKKLKVAN